MQNSVIFVLTRLPKKDGKGDQVVSYYRIQSFLQLGFKISIALISRAPPSEKVFCIESSPVNVTHFASTKADFIIGFLHTLLLGYPLQTALFYNGRLLDWVSKSTEAQVVYFTTFRTMLFSIKRLNAVRERLRNTRLVIDFIDAFSLNYARTHNRYAGLKKYLFKIEAERVNRCERALYEFCDISLFVSRIDKEALGFNNALIIKNGVSIKFLQSENKIPKNMKKISFWGNLNYHPNIDAVNYFLASYWEKVLRVNPNYTFYIYGRGGSDKNVSYWNSFKNVKVVGEVSDLASEVADSLCSVALLRTGAGMQNKVLESLALGIPVFTTSIGRGDISATKDQGLIVIDEAKEMLSWLEDLSNDDVLRDRMSEASSKFIISEHNWQKNNLYFGLRLKDGL